MSPRDEHLDPCGCCEAAPAKAPAGNRPGLPAVRYRRDTHPTAFAAMKARLHRWTIPDGDHAGTRPLAALSTRAPDDPAIALLDAWAVITDVLTFYQERIANEGWLRTATERRSVLELARSIGYELRPGVAASAWLAFRVEEAEGAPEHAEIPAGTPVQSLPAKEGEVPQTFETAGHFIARRAWNALRPRLHLPQSLSSSVGGVLLEGVGLGIRPGDTLVVEVGAAGTARTVRRVAEDRQALLTRVEFTPEGGTPGMGAIPPAPEAVLDPGALPLPLTRTHVRTRIFERTWTEGDFQAFLTLNGWDEGTVLAHLEDLRTEALRPGAQGIHALRESAGVFGHNAPVQEMLPESVRSRTGPYAAGWDGTDARSVWVDSQGGALSGADLYLERMVEGVAPGGWAVLEAPGQGALVRRVAAVVHGSRADYGMSGKATGLTFVESIKPAAYLTRRTTVRLRSEALRLAPLRLEGTLPAGTTVLPLEGMVTGLSKGRKVILSGEDPSAPGVEVEEVLTLRRVTHARGNTTLHFEETSGTTRAYRRASLVLNANVVAATHGETVADEVLGSGDGAVAHPSFALRKPPLTHVAHPGPRGTASTLTVRVNGVEWHPRESLHGAGPGERVYVVRIDDDGRAWIHFGDGRSGARLPTGQENVRATYRSGIGIVGQVGAGTLTLLPRRPFGVREVTNPLRASGAADPESLDDARENAPLTVRTLGRVVSLEDYQDFARGFAGVGKARADAIWDGESERVHLTVAAADGTPVAEPLLGNLRAAIEGARDPLGPVQVEPHQPFVFFLSAKVRRSPDHLWSDLEEALRKALVEAFSFRRRGFGEPVSAAQILAVMHGVEGVVAVDLDELYRTPPSGPPSGPLFNTVLDARPARWDRLLGRVLPAQLLLVHPQGIQLSEMTP